MRSERQEMQHATAPSVISVQTQPHAGAPCRPPTPLESSPHLELVHLAQQLVHHVVPTGRGGAQHARHLADHAAKAVLQAHQLVQPLLKGGGELRAGRGKGSSGTTFAAVAAAERQGRGQEQRREVPPGRAKGASWIFE